jgi:hypothetical protein
VCVESLEGEPVVRQEAVHAEQTDLRIEVWEERQAGCNRAWKGRGEAFLRVGVDLKMGGSACGADPPVHGHGGKQGGGEVRWAANGLEMASACGADPPVHGHGGERSGGLL